MQAKAWPYGTKRRGTVETIGYVRRQPIQTVIDDTKEAHILAGHYCADPSAKKGDTGTLTFTKGGPTGGYWKFEKDAK